MNNTILGKFLKQRKEFITINDNLQYKRCRVQVNRKGVVLRDVVLGSDIKTKKQQLCKNGDFVVAEIDAKVGGYGFIDQDLEGAIVSSHYYLFEIDTSRLLPGYLNVLIKTNIIQNQINAKGSTNYSSVRPNDILEIQIPDLNIKEQLSIISRYEKISNLLNKLNLEFNDELEKIKLLKKSILSQAVHGNLVSQDLNDEPVSELLKRIKSEKEKLIKKVKLLLPINRDEIPFELPGGWGWYRLGELCNLITDGTHSTPNYVEAGVPFLSVKDISSGKIIFNNCKYITEDEHLLLSKRCKPEYENILLTKIGTTGIAKVIDTHQDFSIFVSLALLKFNKDYIYPYYLEYAINSPVVKKQSMDGTEGVGNKNLVLRKIENFIIPLPPLGEQKRIVEKLNKLIKICIELEDKLNDSKKKAELLMQVVLQEAFKN